MTPQHEPGYLWRGMSGAEFAHVNLNGQIHSDSGRTYFSQHPDVALRFLKRKHQPGTTSYLVKFTDPGLERGAHPSGRYQYFSQPIPGHHIAEEYMVNDDMNPSRVSTWKFAQNDWVIDIGQDIALYDIQPINDPVQMAMSQGAQLEETSPITAAWKTAAAPREGSEWEYYNQVIKVHEVVLSLPDPRVIFYYITDPQQQPIEMPMHTWEMYVRNSQIVPVTAVDMDAPGNMITEPLVGWRVWKVSGYSNGYWAPNVQDPTQTRITSPVRDGHIWEPGVKFEADAEPNMGHRAGAYACLTREILAEKQGSLDEYPVLGEVYQWGKVVKATEGFRSQFCYPKCFYIRDRALIPMLSQYNVPIIWEDKAIFRFAADGWDISPTANGLYVLQDQTGTTHVVIDAGKKLDGNPSEIEFQEIRILDSAEHNLAVQHIAYWIETLVANGAKVQWHDDVANEHTIDGEYNVDYDWNSQQVHEVKTRTDLLALEEKLLNSRHEFTDSDDNPRVSYENGNTVDEYGLPQKSVTYLETPPKKINMTLARWEGLFDQFLTHIYQGVTDENQFNLKEPQDIKALVETFWTTLAETTGSDDLHSGLKDFSLDQIFPPLYTRLVRFAQSLDPLHTAPQPQVEQLFDPDQYINGVRITNPLARFALQYLENLFDMTASAIGTPKAKPRDYWHVFDGDPKNWNNVTVPSIPNVMSKVAAPVDPGLFDVVYSAYCVALQDASDGHTAVQYVLDSVYKVYGPGRWSKAEIAQALDWASKAIAAAWPDDHAINRAYRDPDWMPVDEMPPELVEQMRSRLPNNPIFSSNFSLAQVRALPADQNPFQWNAGDVVEDRTGHRLYITEADHEMGSPRGIHLDHGSNAGVTSERWYNEFYGAGISLHWQALVNTYAYHRVAQGQPYPTNPVLDTPGEWTLQDLGIPPEGEQYYRSAKLWKQSEWTLDDVRDAQAYVNQQIHYLFAEMRTDPQVVNEEIMKELTEAEMPHEWAVALLMAGWAAIEGWEPTGYDTPGGRDFHPVPDPLNSDLPNAKTWFDAVYDPNTVENDWRMSALRGIYCPECGSEVFGAEESPEYAADIKTFNKDPRTDTACQNFNCDWGGRRNEVVTNPDAARRFDPNPNYGWAGNDPDDWMLQ